MSAAWQGKTSVISTLRTSNHGDGGQVRGGVLIHPNHAHGLCLCLLWLQCHKTPVHSPLIDLKTDTYDLCPCTCCALRERIDGHPHRGMYCVALLPKELQGADERPRPHLYDEQMSCCCPMPGRGALAAADGGSCNSRHGESTLPCETINHTVAAHHHSAPPIGGRWPIG